MKTKFEIIKLRFETPLHIGDDRLDYGTSQTFIHSDTMYAAIMNAWACLGKEEWIAHNQDFTISSLFPYFQETKNSEPIVFFPKPYHLNLREDSNPQKDWGKKLKKIVFIDKETFEENLNSNLNIDEDNFKGKYLSKKLKNGQSDFMESGISPRIMKPRDEAADTSIFYMDKIYFKYYSGLYFIMDANSKMKEKTAAALNYLSDSGIGTDRTVGQGKFEYSFDNIEINVPNNSPYSLNLSLFCPENHEQLKDILNNNSKYDFIKRGGWIGEPYNSYRKKSIYMFREGSVFKTSESIIGKTVDLKPEQTPKNIDHPILRVGKSLFLPISIS